jgi:hypothetical protein
MVIFNFCVNRPYNPDIATYQFQLLAPWFKLPYPLELTATEPGNGSNSKEKSNDHERHLPPIGFDNVDRHESDHAVFSFPVADGSSNVDHDFINSSITSFTLA